jgi:hypothetical protein
LKIRAIPLYLSVALLIAFMLLTPHFGFRRVMSVLALTPFLFTVCVATCVSDEYDSNQSLQIMTWGAAASVFFGLFYWLSQIALGGIGRIVGNFVCAAGAAYCVSEAATQAFAKFRKRLPSNISTTVIATAAAVPGLFLKAGAIGTSVMCALWLALMAFALTRPVSSHGRRRVRSSA